MMWFNRLIAATPVLGAGYFAYLAWSFTPGAAGPFEQTDTFCTQPQLAAQFAMICKDLRVDRPFPPSKKTYEVAATMLLLAGVLWELGVHFESTKARGRVVRLADRRSSATAEKKAA